MDSASSCSSRFDQDQVVYSAIEQLQASRKVQETFRERSRHVGRLGEDLFERRVEARRREMDDEISMIDEESKKTEIVNKYESEMTTYRKSLKKDLERQEKELAEKLEHKIKLKEINSVRQSAERNSSSSGRDASDDNNGIDARLANIEDMIGQLTRHAASASVLNQPDALDSVLRNNPIDKSLAGRTTTTWEACSVHACTISTSSPSPPPAHRAASSSWSSSAHRLINSSSSSSG